MTTEPVNLLLTITSAASDDPQWLDERARYLLAELRDLGVTSAKLATRGEAPPGAKAAATINPGVLTMDVEPTALQPLFDFLASWQKRGGTSTIKIEYRGLKMELTSDRPTSPEAMPSGEEKLYKQRIAADLVRARADDVAASDNQLLIRTILFLAADPTDLARLRLGEELREIQAGLQRSTQRDQFKLEQRLALRPADVSQALLDTKPAIIHFSGHGTNTGELCFEDEAGQAKPVEANALAALFELVQQSVDCVILSACFSELQAKAIARHIRYVIGMNTDIGDKAAIAFAVGFYQALGAGKAIDEAFQFGCTQIGLEGIPEHLTPVLIGR